MKSAKAKFSDFAVTKDLIESLCESKVISTFNKNSLIESTNDKEKPDYLFQILERKGWENFKTARNILNSYSTQLSELWDEKLIEEVPILKVRLY